MKMSATMSLTSWASQADPAQGDFTFRQDQDQENQYIVEKLTSPYWRSGVSGSLFNSDNIFLVSSLLPNFSRKKMPKIMPKVFIILD
ncbi:g-type lectin s-receptor-like serine/threonine-protein kinase [Quercus suber]|uniref:G-type lectin s-receptor-like serine/threonine-protein kinase n=1 Tax=Quercus suber TaxID=58331 RepID=A0AAW0K2P9_QUESU